MKKKKTKMVFSKKKYKEYGISVGNWDEYRENNCQEGVESWQNQCEGKTRAECKKMNYGIYKYWMVEVDA